MAARLNDTVGMSGNTPLPLDGKGWSRKYNLLWDKVLKADACAVNWKLSSRRFHRMNRNLDFRDEFLRFIRDSIIDHGDFF